VEIGLRWDPKNLALLDRLLMIAGIHQTPQASVLQGAAVFGLLGAGSAREVLTNWVGIQEAESQEGAKKLRELAAREPTPQLHFILGVYENQHKNLNAARFHFEQSHKGNPDVPTVANNLAWLLMQTSPDELPRALELIETAIKLDGGRDPNFRDTRGRIHFKMGVRKADAGDAAGARKEYLLAVDDLEATIWTTPIKADVNRTLADVYRRLGMEDMADEHARQADENTPKKKTGKR
jgi:Tfp pilus assembly protein PilF